MAHRQGGVVMHMPRLSTTIPTSSMELQSMKPGRSLFPTNHGALFKGLGISGLGVSRL